MKTHKIMLIILLGYDNVHNIHERSMKIFNEVWQ